MSQMKRQLTRVLLCIILGTIFLSSASASIIAGAKVKGDWEYTVSGNEATIVYYNGNFETDVTIPSKLGGKKVTSIAWGAFAYLPKLRSIIIPDSVTTIANAAFMNSTVLRTVTIGKGVKDVDGNPFDGCTRLQTIHIADNHPYLQLIDGVLFTKDPMRLVCYPASKTQSSYTLPDGVVEIGDSAFSPNNSIKTLVIPSSVTKIHSTAFNTGSGEKKSITLDVTQNAYAKSYAVEKNMRYIENLPEKTVAPTTATSSDSYQAPTRENQYTLYGDHRFGEKMTQQQIELSLSFLGFEKVSLILSNNNNEVLDYASYYFPSRLTKATAQEDYKQVESQLEQIYSDFPTTDGHGRMSSVILAMSALIGGEISSIRRYDQEYGMGIEHVLMKWGDEYRHFVGFEVYNMESFQERVPLLVAEASASTTTPVPTATPTSTAPPTPTDTLATPKLQKVGSASTTKQEVENTKEIGDINLSSMSLSELMALEEQLLEAMKLTDDWQEVHVPAGFYRVDEDIPAAHWQISPLDSGYAYIRYGDNLDKTGNRLYSAIVYGGLFDENHKGYNASEDTTTIDIDFKTGCYFEVDNAGVIFTPYVGKSIRFIADASSATLEYQVDFSKNTLSDLESFRTLIHRYMWETNEWDEIWIPAGFYCVGTDIPEGHWQIAPHEKGYTYIRYGEKLDITGSRLKVASVYGGLTDKNYKAYNASEDTTSLDIDFKSGCYFEVDNAGVIITQYKGKKLGFK